MLSTVSLDADKSLAVDSDEFWEVIVSAVRGSNSQRASTEGNDQGRFPECHSHVVVITTRFATTDKRRANPQTQLQWMSFLSARGRSHWRQTVVRWELKRLRTKIVYTQWRVLNSPKRVKASTNKQYYTFKRTGCSPKERPLSLEPK